jgi:hypothetical protein
MMVVRLVLGTDEKLIVEQGRRTADFPDYIKKWEMSQQINLRKFTLLLDEIAAAVSQYPGQVCTIICQNGKLKMHKNISDGNVDLFSAIPELPFPGREAVAHLWRTEGNGSLPGSGQFQS